MKLWLIPSFLICTACTPAIEHAWNKGWQDTKAYDYSRPLDLLGSVGDKLHDWQPRDLSLPVGHKRPCKKVTERRYIEANGHWELKKVTYCAPYPEQNS